MQPKVTIRRVLAVGLAAFALMGASAARAADDAVHYVVQPGDTLIGLGQTLLQNPERWPTIQRLNAVADPYRMPVGAICASRSRCCARSPARRAWCT